MRVPSLRHLVLLGVLLAASPAPAEERVLLLATTTSVRDSGLLDELLPRFQADADVRVKTIAVGTGAALRLGAEGNVDVLLTHAPSAEQELVASGAVISREPFMENHFVIAGPPEDPAGIREAASPAEAYRRLAAASAAYVSRGDDSGTHKRELALLTAAGLPASEAWPGFLQTGSGMGLALQVAGQRRAYVLADIGTFLAYRDRTELASLSRPDPELRNVYSVLRVNPALFPGRIEGAAAEQFAAFLLAAKTQELIGSFGVERFGRPLFRPLFAKPEAAG
jgi:tungstate transport system substrate-binding protein